MKTHLFLLTLPIIILMMTIGVVLAAPFDSGYRLWIQPNGISFTARQWGDEFFSWFETLDEYRIYKSVDGWYYYAKLDTTGEFAASASRVGVDPPLPSSFQLERSPARIAQIEQLIYNSQTRYSRSLQEEKENIQQSMTATPETLKLAIVLVEFTDSVHYNPNVFPRIGGYLKSDFEKEFFSSSNEWFDTSQTNGTPHPENDKVFGSFRDYWNQMSHGKLIITGQVVNPMDPGTGVPKWIRLNNNWTYYFNSTHQVELAQEGISKAQDSGYISPVSGQPNYYHKKIVIYAGKAYANGALKVAGEAHNGSFLWIGERTGRSIYYENTAFLHIGTPAHEFGHLIGFFDEYGGGSTGEVAGTADCNCTYLGNYDLMGTGLYNGPLRKGECPASLSPFYRIQMDWDSSIVIQDDALNMKIAYSYQHPKFYRINPLGRDTVFDEHYIVESRLRQGFDEYVPTIPEQFPSQPGIFLIWHHARRIVDSYNSDMVDRIRLVTADTSKPDSSYLSGFFPKDGIRQRFNDLSVPKAVIKQDRDVNPRFDYPAHFALNGIHRHVPVGGNDSDYTIIDTVALKLTMASGTLTQNEIWSNDVWVVSDVTVQNGVILNILPGTKVIFSPGMILNVNGKLIAKGTSTQHITFTSSLANPAPADWGGIICSGGGPDTLNYCDISYGESGLWLQNTSANSYLQNDTIKYSSYWGYGLNVMNTGTANSSLKMYKCGINSNDGIGVRVSNAKVSISYSRIENNGLQSISEGVYVLGGARVFFDSSRIQNNNGSGIKISGTGSRALLTPDSAKTGYNTVYQHGVSELWLTSSGSAFLGGGYYPGNYGGYNNVYNTYNYNCRLINNGTSNPVSAKWTYWGSIGTRFCGPVDSSSWLVSPINTPALMRYHDPGEEPMAEVWPSTTLNDWLIQLKSDIANNSENAFDALHHLANFSGSGGAYQSVVGMSWENYLSAVINKSALPNVKSLAIGLLVQSSLDKGDFARAVASADDELGKTMDDDLRFFLQTRKIYAEVGRGNISSAKDVLSEVQATASLSDTDAVKAMTEYVSVASKSAQDNGAPGHFVKNAISQDQTPNRYILSQNFPNPFNPTTSFKYEIAIAGHVILKIYDVLGREVALIVNEEKDPGEYNVTWDAGNYPSGVYFFKLQAGAFTDVKKMLLVR